MTEAFVNAWDWIKVRPAIIPLAPFLVVTAVFVLSFDGLMWSLRKLHQ